MSEPPPPWGNQPGPGGSPDPLFSEPSNDSFFDQTAPAEPAETLFGQPSTSDSFFSRAPAETFFDQAAPAETFFAPSRPEPSFGTPDRPDPLYDQSAPAETFFEPSARPDSLFDQSGRRDPLFDQQQPDPPRYESQPPALPDLGWPGEQSTGSRPQPDRPDPYQPDLYQPEQFRADQFQPDQLRPEPPRPELRPELRSGPPVPTSPPGRALPDLLGEAPDDSQGLFDDWKTTDRQPMFDEPELFGGLPEARGGEPAAPTRRPLFADAPDDGPNSGPPGSSGAGHNVEAAPFDRIQLDQPGPPYRGDGPAAIDTAPALPPIPGPGEAEGEFTRRSRMPARERRNPIPEPTEEPKRKGMPGWFGVLIGLGSAIGIAALDLRLTGTLTVFFGLCFIITAFGVAAGVRREHLFTAGVSPPLYALGAITVIAIVAPQSLVRGETSPLVASLSGLAGQWWSIVAATTIALGTCALRVAIEGPVDDEDDYDDEDEPDPRADNADRTPPRPPQRQPRPSNAPPPNRPPRPPQRQPREDPSAARAAKRR